MAKSTIVFGRDLQSVYFNIFINLKMIEELSAALNALLEQMHNLVEANHSKKFIKQIYWLDSISGVGFLSAVTIMK